MESLNGQLWQKLQEIIATYGADICDEPGRLEGLLRDQCGQYKREIRLLINTLKEGVVSELRLGKESMPVEVLVPRLCKKIEENLLLSPDAAEWAVKSWAVALGLSESLRQKAEEELKHVNKARTKDEVAVKVELQAKAASGPGILGRVRSFFGGAKSTSTYVPPPSPPKPSSRGPRSGYRGRLPQKIYLGDLVMGNAWHPVDFDNLRGWAQRAKARLDSGEVLKGSHFMYRMNFRLGTYEIRLRSKYTSCRYNW